MAREHRYGIDVVWTGNLGAGTTTYRGYTRDHDVGAEGKPTIPGSSGPGVPG